MWGAFVALALVLGAKAPGTHTVVPGDTCWDISVHYVGDGFRYPELYQANQQLIESTAQAHGFSSSDFCHWIFPGQQFEVPTSWLPVAPPSPPADPVGPVAPTPSPSPSPRPTSTPTSGGDIEAGGGDDNTERNLLIFAIIFVLIEGFLIAVACLKNRHEDEPEGPIEQTSVAPAEPEPERPIIDPPPSPQEVEHKFGTYSRAKHLELFHQVNQKAVQATAALVSFGWSASAAPTVMAVPTEQLALQRQLTVWAVDGLGRLNSDGTVTLYRGFKDRTVAEDVYQHKRTTKVCSFTFSRPTAIAFDGGGVIVARVPINLIAGSYLSAPYPIGEEYEVTVLAGRLAEVELYDPDKVPSIGNAPARIK